MCEPHSGTLRARNGGLGVRDVDSLMGEARRGAQQGCPDRH